MTIKTLKQHSEKLDTKELEVPETVFIRDIENRVFQGIVLQCLAKIPGIALIEGNFIDHILGRDNLEGIRSIHVEQDSKQQCVSIRIEVSISYGVAIPQKAEQIQVEVSEAIAKLTGLHVSSIHVVFKNIITEDQIKKHSDTLKNPSEALLDTPEEEYSDTF